jgi:hypothetical protein
MKVDGYLRTAQSQLEEIESVQQAEAVRLYAVQAREYFKRVHAGAENMARARRIALQAKRELGRLLRKTVLSRGAITSGNNGWNCTEAAVTLESLGITPRISSEAQQLASLSEESFESICSGLLTEEQGLKIARRLRAEASKASSNLRRVLWTPKEKTAIYKEFVGFDHFLDRNGIDALRREYVMEMDLLAAKLRGEKG